MDAINIGGKKGAPAHHVIIDHCSFGWSIDEVADSYRNAIHFTLQWCIFSEGLRHSIHEKGDHSMGLLLGPGTTQCSIHHNLFAHNNSRNPRIKGGRRDFVNNIIYNWGSIAGMFTDHPEINFISNYYKPGADSGSGLSMISGEDLGTIFIQGNIYPGDRQSDWELVRSGRGAVRAEKRFDAPAVTTYPASELPDKVLPQVGCVVPVRDAVDERIIRDVREGTGKIIDNPGEVGGYPVISGGDAPADRDHDGMPDSWESSHGLNPDDSADASADRDGDGYTNVEEYISSLVK
jgi:hypothetical protein